MNAQREVVYKRRRHAFLFESDWNDIANMFYDNLRINHAKTKQLTISKLWIWIDSLFLYHHQLPKVNSANCEMERTGKV
jgi:hypothetical protein